MSEKEKLMEYINNPTTVSARNSMGCDENWYNPYFSINKTFTYEEIENMTDKEVLNLVKLADAISEALY